MRSSGSSPLGTLNRCATHTQHTSSHLTVDDFSAARNFLNATRLISQMIFPSLSLPLSQWWDRVFKDDEPIETSCCSVGGDVSQLPAEARERAQRESTRFTDLSEEARREEMAAATQAKKVHGTM